jgi:pectate lyase
MSSGAMAGAALLFIFSSAHATFMIDPNPGGEQFFNGNANKDVSTFTGTVGGQHSGPEVTVDTVGNVDTGAGFSNIKPVKDGTLTLLTFTPADPNLFGDFSFRGQLEAAAGGQVVLTVQDNRNHAPQQFTFDGLGTNADFARIGIIAVPGSGETIKTVTLSSVFKEQKQNEFSLAAPIPEPQTYAMLAVGLVLLGVAGSRRIRLK